MNEPRASRRTRSWNALRSAYYAFSGLLWIAPRTPSIKLGMVAGVALAGLGWYLGLSREQVAILVLVGTVVLATETLNTAIEMLCDHVQPNHDPLIGKVKDVAAGATAFAEIGGAVILSLLLGPAAWHRLHG